MIGWWVTSNRWKLHQKDGTKIGNLRAGEDTQNTMVFWVLMVFRVLPCLSFFLSASIAAK
jgi:hypothetical protein